MHLLEWEIPFPQSVKTPTYLLSCSKAPLRILAPWQIHKVCGDATQSNSCIFTTVELFFFLAVQSHIPSRDERITVCGDSDCINHEAWLGVSLPADAHMSRSHRRDVWQVLSRLALLQILSKMVSRSTIALVQIIKPKLWSLPKLSPLFLLRFKSVICDDLLSLMYCPNLWLSDDTSSLDLDLVKPLWNSLTWKCIHTCIRRKLSR